IRCPMTPSSRMKWTAVDGVRWYDIVSAHATRWAIDRRAPLLSPMPRRNGATERRVVDALRRMAARDSIATTSTMETNVKLCGFRISNYHNKVRLVLLEKGIAHEEDDACAPSQEAAFLERSVLGKVPF